MASGQGKKNHTLPKSAGWVKRCIYGSLGLWGRGACFCITLFHKGVKFGFVLGFAKTSKKPLKSALLILKSLKRIDLIGVKGAIACAATHVSMARFFAGFEHVFSPDHIKQKGQT